MTIILSKVSERIFDILKGSGQNLFLFDDSGTRIYDSKKATKIFSEPSNIMVIIDSEDSGHVKLYVSSDTDILMNKKIIDMISQTARHYNMDYTLRKFGKKITPKDFAHLSESTLYGSSKSSYQNIGDVKLIIRHTAKIDEEIRGARSRKINAIFLEDKMGQRFKMTTNWLNGNRAIARYVSEGGELFNDTGIKLKRLVEQYSDCKILFRYVKSLKEQNTFTKDLMVNTYEKIMEINSIIKGLNSKTLYEETLNKVNNINNILNEDDISSKVENLSNHLMIDLGDNKMNKIIENAVALGLDEARKKKTVDFEVTPQIKKWAEILQKLDAFTSDDTDRLYGPEGEEIAEVDFLNQAKRLANKEIKRFPGAKQAVLQDKLSSNPETARFQKLADYYATIAQYLNPNEDAILSNIISRLSDHYMYLIGDTKTTMSQNDPQFKFVENLADAVAKMVGVNKAQYESVMEDLEPGSMVRVTNPNATPRYKILGSNGNNYIVQGPSGKEMELPKSRIHKTNKITESTQPIGREALNAITEFFNAFKVDTIVNEERTKKLLKQKKAISEKITKIKESKNVESKQLVEDQEKFFGLATKAVHFSKDPARLKKLTKYLNESQKKRLINVIEGTWNKKVSRKIMEIIGLNEFDKAAEAKQKRIERANQVLSVAGEIRNAAKEIERGMDADQQLVFARQFKDNLTDVFQLLDALGFSKARGQVGDLIKDANTIMKGADYAGNFANKVVNVLYDAVMTPIQRTLDKRGDVTEAKDGRKATSAMNSSDRIARSMEKVGSARQFALDKARGFVAKGMDARKALEVVGIPATGKTLDYVRAGAQMAEPEDRYAAMAKKYGIKESAKLAIFSGTVRNKLMFVEAITKEKGATYGKVATHILEGKPFNKIKKSLLEGVADYALAKKEEELSGSILRVINPVKETTNELPLAKNYVKVVVEGLFKDLTGEVLSQEGAFYTVKLNDVIDEQVFHEDEVTVVKDTSDTEHQQVISALKAAAYEMGFNLNMINIDQAIKAVLKRELPQTGDLYQAARSYLWKQEQK